MSDRVQKFLQLVSADQPTGPDLSYDPKFDELESTLQGKPEVEIGSVVRPAEPPDWRALTGQAEELFTRTKHLRVAVVLTCCWLKKEGAPGLQDGLALVRELLEQQWDKLYPLLDPEDNNDPTQRLNILRALTASRGSVTGWLTIADYLYEMPLAQPKGGAPITYAQVVAARRKAEGGAADGPELSSIMQALRTAGAEQTAARCAELQGALEAVQGIDQFITSKLGAGDAISFDVLESLLRDLLAVLQPPQAGAGVDPVTGGGAATDAGTGEAGGTGSITIAGVIRSRDDVVRALDGICDYYRQVEPGSPVPFLLRRAQKLAAMNFVQAMQELNLATVDALRPSMGSAVESEAPPAT